MVDDATERLVRASGPGNAGDIAALPRHVSARMRLAGSE
jgi:hypothetical protein